MCLETLEGDRNFMLRELCMIELISGQVILQEGVPELTG